jgi:hypothetical protein
MLKSEHALIEHCRAIREPAPQTDGRSTRSRPELAPNRALVLPTVLLGSGYLIIYVLLDWLSFIEPYAQFAITPWNPNTGANFALVLIFGTRMIPFMFIAPIMGDLVVRHFPLPISVELSSAAAIGGCMRPPA